jgi:signal transduction histidine kinase
MVAQPIRILLVEDDAPYARLMRERLRDQLEVAIAGVSASLAAAIGDAAAVDPQVVLLDLALPDSEGIATVDAFHAAHPRLPLVVLSGQDSVDVAVEAMRHGAQDYLVKGPADATLVPRIARLAIERKRLQDVEQMLVGVVSHDLRGPLQTIALSCELVLAESQGPSRTWVNRALTAVRRANRLVDDLLDATRARLGGLLPIERAPVDLVRLVEQATDEHRGRAADRVIGLEAPATLVASCDANRISQVVNNLVGNAIQHSPASSIVRVVVRAIADRGAEIAVHNLGPAIPEELRSRIFEPLERVEITSTNHSIGLGLYIVHEIVHAHGGTITVESTPADGTTFRVWLPAARTAVAGVRSDEI